MLVSLGSIVEGDGEKLPRPSCWHGSWRISLPKCNCDFPSRSAPDETSW